MDDKFWHVYQHAVRVARNVNVEPTMPRVAGRQIHRCNAPADNPEQYYQRNVAVPLITHIKAELDEQFSNNFINKLVPHTVGALDSIRVRLA